MLETLGTGGELADGCLAAQDGVGLVERSLEPGGELFPTAEGDGAVERLEQRAVPEEVEVEREGMFGVSLFGRPVEIAEVVVEAFQLAPVEL